MRKIIALEGLPCAGKTTFLNKFKENNSGFYCVPELYVEIKEDSTSSSIREQYANAELNKKRTIDGVDKNVLFDRSFLSTMAFSYSKHKTTGDNGDYIYNKKFMEENKHNIIIPDFVFVLVITPKESIERRSKMTRDNSQSFWKNELFLKNFMNFYYTEDFYSIIPKAKVLFVNTEDNNKEETYKIITNNIINT